MKAINEIDYDRLAKIAEHTRVDFTVLCARAERGETIKDPEAEIAANEWVGYKEAAEILGVIESTLASNFTQHDNKLEYWGVKWRSKSKNKPKEGKRGCGIQFYRIDIERIGHIRKSTQLRLLQTLRVFQAQKQGYL